jgi:hypothetical protein
MLTGGGVHIHTKYPPPSRPIDYLMMMKMRIRNKPVWPTSAACRHPLRGARCRIRQPRTPVSEVSQGLSQLSINDELFKLLGGLDRPPSRLI